MSSSTAAPAVSHASHGVDHGGHGHHELSFLRKYVFSTDHKVIGMQYLFSCLFTLLVGGLLALMVRWNIAYPEGAKATDAQIQALRDQGLSGPELKKAAELIDNDTIRLGRTELRFKALY